MVSNYYAIAKSGSLDKTHPAYVLIQEYSENATKILDLGCGEGTRLNLINNKNAVKVGVDISPAAISLVKKQYPKITFKKISYNLPFPDNFFDFVYSAFVLEHTKDSERFIKEAVRVLARGGILLFVAPKFGSPNRASPNNKTNRLTKLLTGVKNDFHISFSRKLENLGWEKVVPLKTYNFIDADTRVEPYLLSFEKFMIGLGIKIIKKSSLWEKKYGFSFFQLQYRLLGSLGVWPFRYWGPHLLLIGQKPWMS